MRTFNKPTGPVVCLPFCGGKLSDLTSDEFNCKHLRVVYVTDEGEYLKGDDTRGQERGREIKK